ncbi:hypothetical protein DUNSADRAFT_18380 [Dunaliella salina]|uniref:MYND-type domain-containing protein n=1 Tax=Dunaliella salina TaxID=3046 RepID=A0ABQ7G062_DUNSA|nr:hypothetical protein DUNSADRAFT_18380 [Dunaliella salina]|eukprot:KAF5827993.1 hypothetical protein DUNSADRAFT_18380 [Dunaliella salina]
MQPRKRKTPPQPGSTLPFPLFQMSQALESNHKSNSAARAACEADPELAPGHNCCALCACVPQAGALLPCPSCSRVAYCSKEHMEVDGTTHRRVCGLLACMAASEEIDVSPEDLEELLLEFLASTKAEGLPPNSSWCDVVPQHLAPLLGDGSQETSESEEDDVVKRLPSKRQRSLPPGPSPLREHEAEGCQHKDTEHGGDSEEESFGEQESKVAGSSWNEVPAAWESQLQDATDLAVLSSYLSYPLTLARAIKDCEPLFSAAQQAQEEGRPLVVAVLGASGNAELQHTCVWKALEGAAGPGVPIVLQFVGLSVPSDMHNQQEQLGSAITAAYYLGEYQQLADKVLGRAKPRRPSSKVAMSAAALAAQCAAAAAAANAGRFCTEGQDGGDDRQMLDADMADDEQERQELGVARDGAEGADGGMEDEAGGASAERAQTGAGTSSCALPTALAALPDVIVGYNCGLSCEDYDWQGTYRALRRWAHKFVRQEHGILAESAYKHIQSTYRPRARPM